MNITFDNDSVEIKTLLELHDITMKELTEITSTAIDGYFTIGINKYLIVEEKKKVPNYRGTFTLSKDGKMIDSGLYAKEVCFILKITTSTLTGHFKRKGDNVTTQGYFIEKDDKSGLEVINAK